jgi:hypothetical protein
MEQREVIAQLAREVAMLRQQVAEMGVGDRDVVEMKGLIIEHDRQIGEHGTFHTGTMLCDDGSVWSFEQDARNPHTNRAWTRLTFRRIGDA